MRQLDLSDYSVTMPNEQGEPTPSPYLVRISLVTLFMRPDLHLGAVELLLREKIALRILDGPPDLLLEETDYDKLRSAIDTYKGFSRPDVELVRRVLEAPQVEVAVIPGG